MIVAVQIQTQVAPPLTSQKCQSQSKTAEEPFFRSVNLIRTYYCSVHDSKHVKLYGFKDTNDI